MRGGAVFWYTTHLFARKARTSILENRKLETKENYNSYTRSDGHPSEARRKFLAKRIRAHDGCLGIGRRGRTRKTAKSVGEPSTGFDPAMSEWGNPAGVMSRRPRVNEIARGSHTWGSETSQYPQEEKSSEIARVAASESAGAQTEGPVLRGCGTGRWHAEG